MESKDVSLRLARIYYLGVWCAVIIYAALSECDVLPSAYVQVNAQLEYALNMLCVLFTLCCTWGALRLFALKKLRTLREAKPQMLPMLNVLRTTVLATAIFINVLVYYALMHSTTPLFCLLITLLGFVFCWPKANE